jgi:uncharacterized protein (TIGR03086 family)
MTDTDLTDTDLTDTDLGAPSLAPPTDIRAPFARAVATAQPVIAAVRPDQLGDPTSCDQFDVRQVLDHLVGALRKVARIGRGESPFAPDETVADGKWSEAWTAAAHETRAAWTDDATLRRMVRLPWTEMTGEKALEVYLSEITVHTWDLATATGQSPAWDVEVVAIGLGAMQRELPAEGRTASYEEAFKHMPAGTPTDPPFAEAVSLPIGAPPIEQLVAWTGRRP